MPILVLVGLVCVSVGGGGAWLGGVALSGFGFWFLVAPFQLSLSGRKVLSVGSYSPGGAQNSHGGKIAPPLFLLVALSNLAAVLMWWFLFGFLSRFSR